MKTVIILFIILAIIFIVILKLISKIEKELEEIRNNLNKEETHTIKIEDSQNFWEKCDKCEYFDGYDICLHKKNFGSVTDESKKVCKNKNLWQQKL